MMILLVIIHVIACVVLIGLVLIQRGRGAGLVESFAGVESMFGTKTSTFLTRTTTIMSIVFFITCLSLAILSVRQSKSLMSGIRPLSTAKHETVKTEPTKTGPVKAEAVKTEAIKPEVVPIAKVKPDAPKAQ